MTDSRALRPHRWRTRPAPPWVAGPARCSSLVPAASIALWLAHLLEPRGWRVPLIEGIRDPTFPLASWQLLFFGGMTLAMPRTLYAFARDGFLPRALAALDPRHRTPQAAIAVQSLVSLALAVTGTFERLAIFANVSALALYFGCALAAWRLRASDVSASASAGASVRAVVPWLACAVIAWLLTGLTWTEWLGFGVCVLIATIIYVLRRGLGKQLEESRV